MAVARICPALGPHLPQMLPKMDKEERRAVLAFAEAAKEQYRRSISSAERALEQLSSICAARAAAAPASGESPSKRPRLEEGAGAASGWSMLTAPDHLGAHMVHD